MKAVFMNSTKKYDMSLQEVAVPELEHNEVLIKISYAGICGTDLKIYQGKYVGFEPPVVLGHEFSGQIAEIGGKVEGLNVGDNVTARPGLSYCGGCHLCLSGRPNLCTYKFRHGNDRDGAFAEYIKVHESQVHPLPPGMDIAEAAMIEPLAVVVHALKSVNIKPTDIVLVTGPGTIGLLSLLLSKANGSTVAISGLAKDSKRLDLASELGADLLIEAEKQDSEKALLELTDNEGADIVLECSGSAGGINQGLKLCKPGGKFVQIGTWSHPLTVDFMKIAYKEIEVTGSYAHTIPDWDDSIRLIQQGKINLSSLIEGVYKLEEWEQAFKAVETGERLKVLFKP